MSIRILVIGDILDMLDDIDSQHERYETVMKIVAHKSGHLMTPWQDNSILAELEESSGGKYTIDTARTQEEAIELLGDSLSGCTPRYDVILLDGGFDPVLDYIADMNNSIFDTCPRYVKPISSSPHRNAEMLAKVSVLPWTKPLDVIEAKHFGLAGIIRSIL